MNRCLPFVLLISLAMLTLAFVPEAYASHNSRPDHYLPGTQLDLRVVAKQRQDPCGFRYAVWGLVQETVNYVTDAAAGNLDDYSANQRDAYLLNKMIDTASNYGYPKGWKKLSDAQSSVTVDVHSAIYDGSDQGDQDWFNTEIQKAQLGERTMWSLAKQICPWKGKSFTWTGWIDQFGYGIASTRTFTTSRSWEVDWDFWCPDKPGTFTQSTGNFIVSVYSAGRELFDIPVNKLETYDGGWTRSFPRGSYYLKVISECAWQVKVVPA